MQVGLTTATKLTNYSNIDYGLIFTFSTASDIPKIQLLIGGQIGETIINTERDWWNKKTFTVTISSNRQVQIARAIPRGTNINYSKKLSFQPNAGAVMFRDVGGSLKNVVLIDENFRSTNADPGRPIMMENIVELEPVGEFQSGYWYKVFASEGWNAGAISSVPITRCGPYIPNER